MKEGISYNILKFEKFNVKIYFVVKIMIKYLVE